MSARVAIEQGPSDVRRPILVYQMGKFARPFPHHRGYDILERAGDRLLVLLCESPDDIKRSAVDSFLGFRLEALVRTNVGDEKHYGAIY